VLARIAGGIAYRAVRTRGTIGGSLCHADPAADWLITLTALHAVVLTTERAVPLDRFVTVTLPLMAPGILAGGVVAFAAGLGEFGAVITFASNIPGETQTLPLAIYAATQVPGGEATAAKLSAVSFTLAIVGLLLSEVIARRMRRLLGM
jgi:ABC-type molybdate transport system permease subunit